MYVGSPAPPWFQAVSIPPSIPWAENVCVSNAPCYNWTMVQQIPDAYCEKPVNFPPEALLGSPTCSWGRTMSGNLYGKQLNLVLAEDPPYVYYSASRAGNARFTGAIPDALE